MEVDFLGVLGVGDVADRFAPFGELFRRAGGGGEDLRVPARGGGADQHLRRGGRRLDGDVEADAWVFARLGAGEGVGVIVLAAPGGGGGVAVDGEADGLRTLLVVSLGGVVGAFGERPFRALPVQRPASARAAAAADQL